MPDLSHRSAQPTGAGAGGSITRRHALTTAAAGAIAASLPGVASASPAPAALGPNDQRIWDLYGTWCERRREVEALSAEADRIAAAAVPGDLQDRIASACEALWAAGDADPRDDATIARCRDEMFALHRQERAYLDGTGYDAACQRSERARDTASDVQEELVSIQPDTWAGAVPLLRMLDWERELEPGLCQSFASERAAKAVQSIMVLVKRETGEA
jgi:hypothetical protein